MLVSRVASLTRCASPLRVVGTRNARLFSAVPSSEKSQSRATPETVDGAGGKAGNPKSSAGSSPEPSGEVPGGLETQQASSKLKTEPIKGNADRSTDEMDQRQNSWLLTDDPTRKAIIDRMIRVDHAGEMSASQIYSGQLAVFGGTKIGEVLQEMKDQEQEHLDTFDRLIQERRVRPTALMPVWNVAGYALGLGTALLGKEAAMACTVAVEEVIADHYNDQVRQLLETGFEDEGELRSTFRQFRDEELEHKHTGLEHDAERAPMYRAMSELIKVGCRGAIYITEKI